MRRNGFLSAGLLVLACLPGMADDDPPALAVLRSENEILRRERDALEARLRMAQDQLDEARRSNTTARFEIEALELRCKKLQEELKQSRTTFPLTRLFPEVAPSGKGDVVRGSISALSADLRLVQISIGEDAGVKVGQLLDVFRLSTEKERIVPLYLGTLRITRVESQAALGQYERVPSLDRAPRIGDRVSNELK
jgi:hypothetical protein